MKKRPMVLVVLALFVVCITNALAQTPQTKAVFRIGNDIYTMAEDGELRQLTFDGKPKGWPIWSKGGSKIAYSPDVDPSIALGDIAIIDGESGRQLQEIHVCPTDPKVGYSVERIDGIEWLTDDRIAAVGSVNPSTAETFVYDIKTGSQVDDYIDDAGGAVFSPDGKHVATLSGSPHWTPEDSKEPELDIDDQRVYPAKGVHMELVSGPTWSDDGSRIAAVFRNYQTNEISLVVCGLHGQCIGSALPSGTQNTVDDYLIQWSGSRVYVTSDRLSALIGASTVKSWSFQQDEARAMPDKAPRYLQPTALDSPQIRLAKLHQVGGDEAVTIFNNIQKLGGSEADFWCQNCALATMPRKAPR